MNSIIQYNNETINIPYIDGWRGFAILMALIAHFTPIPGFNSGKSEWKYFCAAWIFNEPIVVHKADAVAFFYKRRVSRILPTFFIFSARGKATLLLSRSTVKVASHEGLCVGGLSVW